MRAGRKAQSAAKGSVQPGDLIPDARLKPGEVDRFDNAAIANTVADVALTVDPPTNIALFGPWGSGKSSVYTMIDQRIKDLDKQARVVRYDAWKYGGRDLKRNFIASVAEGLRVKEPAFERELSVPAENTNLDLKGWLKVNRGSLLLGLALAVGLAAFWIVVLAGARSWLSHMSFVNAAQGLVVGSGTVFGLALAALIVGPKALEGAVVKTVTPPPSGDDEFATRFRDLLKVAKFKEDERLIVFIDELDRCSPDDVVATLIDLRTFLELQGCVFIVAVDRDVVEEALGKVPQAKPVRGDEPYYATRGAFLDKIFQHQIALPPLRTRTLTLFARDLVKEQGGLWQELRDHDQDLFDLVVFALVPVHVRSPRRVKVLLNAYATNVRIAQSRGIDWLSRAAEIAVLTVLQTEFPEVAADLLRVPRLLALLRGAEVDDANEVRRVVDKYAPVRAAALGTTDAGVAAERDEAADEASAEKEGAPSLELANPAGDLLSDKSSRAQVDVARETLYTQLGAYLTKIAAANITDPRRDLFYLQAAGQRDGLADPELGDVIDAAADTSPDRVVAAFDSQPSSVLALAVRLLVIEGDQGVGPGRFFAYESACRLIERLDYDDLIAVAKDVAPVVLPNSAAARWPSQALPGALLLASTARQAKTIRALVGQLRTADDDDLLARAARILPGADQATAASVHTLLAEAYAPRPSPLHGALRGLPLEAALALWADAQDRVLAALGQLEHPGVDAPAAALAPRRGAAARPAAPATASPPTGEGRQRLRGLLAAANERPDSEELTSEIYRAAQESTDDLLRAEAEQQAEAVLNNMADAGRVTRHVLTGMRSAEPESWGTWTSLLRGPTGEPALGMEAADVLSTVVLPCIDTIDVDALDQVRAAVVALLPHVDQGAAEPIGQALNTLLVKFRWNAASADDPDWTLRRRSTLALARLLRTVVGDDYVDELIAADVFTPVREQLLDEAAQTELLARIDHLEPGPARQLSARLDTHPVREGEELAQLRLRMRTRTRFDGLPVEVDELSVLDDAAVASEVFTDWLRLQPAGTDVAQVVSRVSPTSASLNEWARRATDEDRTAVWIALEQTHAHERLLRAVGGHGVTGAVAEHMTPKVLEGSRQQDRDDQVARLRTAHVVAQNGNRGANGARTASELAKSLLDTGVGGNARLACQVIVWAGGPAHGYQTKLRPLFDSAVERHDGKFSGSDKSYLEDRGLLTRSRKGLGKRLRGH